MIRVAAVEFDEGGNTIWVQGRDGTVLRIKCSGHVKVDDDCTNIGPHADIMVAGDITVCMPSKRRRAAPTPAVTP